MKRYLSWSLFVFSILPSYILADISADKLKGEAYSDIGQIVKGYSTEDGYAITGSFLTRLGVNINVTDTVKERLIYKVGVGGLFWQPYPNPPTEFWKNNLQFGPGITEASAEFRISDKYGFQGGYFPIKYNPDAMNLGEYLLRTESYPTYLATGGWTWVDSAFTRSLGFRFKASHFDGMFHHELGVYWEFQNSPLFDVTPAYLFSLKPVKGIEIGGGVALKRWFSNNIAFSRTTDSSVILASQYVEIANFPEVQYQGTIHFTTIDTAGKTVQNSAHVSWRPGAAPPDPGVPGATVTGIEVTQVGSAAGMRTGIKKFLTNLTNQTGCTEANPAKCPSYYSTNGLVKKTDANGDLIADSDTAAVITKQTDIFRRAINLMGRVDFDFGEMLDLTATTGPFKLYGEIAVLGVQNQPVYYQKITQRMPIMVGLDIPTFGILDVLDVETEYLDNPYIDSESSLGGGEHAPMPGENMAIPDLTPDQYKLPMFVDPGVHGDDLKWSVHAVKTVLPGVKLKLQMANDHIRLSNFEGTPSPSPLTVKRNNWYYVVHLQWGF